MTDKIIIDGIDVTACFYRKSDNYCSAYSSDVFSFKCSDFRSCFYKQLQRKTAECEKWKEKWNNGFQNFCDKDDELQAEKQKVEELEKSLEQTFKEKDKLNIIIDRLLVASGYDKSTASAEDFEDVYVDMSYKLNKFIEYKQALAEIKEYTAKQFCGNCEDIASTEYSCHCKYCEYQQYFDIISKAKDEKNDTKIF